MRTLLLLSIAATVVLGCKSAPRRPEDAPSSSGSPTAPTAARARAPVREGSTVTRAATNDALYVADEDHGVVRRVSLPVDVHAPPLAVPMPGPPAQVLALGERVLVTIRELPDAETGALLVMRPDADVGLVEVARVALPADAWGVAVSPDESTALVSSAWTHTVSAIDLANGAKRWSIDVPREPRGIVVRSDGKSAYVTHLVGAALTRIDDLDGAPKVGAVELPAAPLRAPAGKKLEASLGYAAASSADGSRLFVARHALGALGDGEVWFGASTVDVLLTAHDEPLAPPRQPNLPKRDSRLLTEMMGPAPNDVPDRLVVPSVGHAPFVQPRALAYRKSTQTLLVASEGTDSLVELDARLLDPTLRTVREYPLASDYDKFLHIPAICAAPSGIALSADESMAWVVCGATYDLAIVRLDPQNGAPFEAGPTPTVRLADDPLGAEVSKGRRFFYNASDTVTSGGLACAGCHPEGRDDGHVWHEAPVTARFQEEATNFLGEAEDAPEHPSVAGYPRQTPMLAGRVAAKGPYGWHAESATLTDRLVAGFSLHRWGQPPYIEKVNLEARALLLAPFLRKGLRPPPRVRHELTPEEARGREIFTSEQARCAKCHAPESEYTDRMAYPLARVSARAGFEAEEGNQFRTPSLLFVGGTAPYFHDGRAATLGALIDQNNDRMGRTNHLSPQDRAALVAFLRTL